MTDSNFDIPSPTLIDVIQAQVRDTKEDIHTSIPAKVVSYNRTRQTAHVKPLVWDWDHGESEDGTDSRVGIAPPVFPDVPIMFPAGGGYRITFPVSVGDQVLLVFPERSIREWRIGGSSGMPKSEVRHGLNGAIAIPGLRAPGRAPLVGNDGEGTPPTALTMGYDTGPQFIANKLQIRLGHGGADQPVIRGDAFKTSLDTLITAIKVAVVAATDTAVGGGSAVGATFQTAVTAFQTAWDTNLSDVVSID